MEIHSMAKYRRKTRGPSLDKWKNFMEIYGDDDDTTDIQDQQEIKVIPLVGYTDQEQVIKSR